MSTKTTNFEFIKPDRSDAADITATNENWDKIDTTLQNINTTADNAFTVASEAKNKAENPIGNEAVTFTRATVLQNLFSNTKLSDLMGQLALLNYRYMLHEQSDNPHETTAQDVGAAPQYDYGTVDLTAGASSLQTGKLYFVYE